MTGVTTAQAALQARIDAQPRVRLAHLPTPLEPCPRFSAALGGPAIWIKRNDLTGLAFGGNKTRQLEFVFADVLAQGADTVVAGAYTQSNWCRQMTAAAKKLGLEVALVLLHGEKGPALQGNLLLDRLMGAEVTVVELDSMERLAPLLEAKAQELARRAQALRGGAVRGREAGARRARLRQRGARARPPARRGGHRPRLPLPLRRQHDARRARARAESARPPRQAGQHRADPLERGA